MEIVEISQNSEKKRVTDHDFRPPFIKCGGRKIKIVRAENIRYATGADKQRGPDFFTV